MCGPGQKQWNFWIEWEEVVQCDKLKNFIDKSDDLTWVSLVRIHVGEIHK